MIINHNISSIFSQRSLRLDNLAADKNIEKLSSGMRINRAGDDASGLAVSEKMRAQINGIRRAEKNVQDAISFIQTTEGYLEETTQILQRIRELSVQAANGIYSVEDRMQIQVEVSQMVAEVDRILLMLSLTASICSPVVLLMMFRATTLLQACGSTSDQIWIRGFVATLVR